jgi:geranylgeranyl pyrophosphate synthase
VQFDEATAILAGDALQALAFQTIAEDETLSMDLRVRLISELASASGVPAGMVAGQALDLEAESRQIAAAELEMIHHQKTGALVRAAARSGAMIAGVGDDRLLAITTYAVNLGLLFQITDDLLDVTATAEDLGKTPGKDARARKATFPAIYGMEAARVRLKAVRQAADYALYSLGIPAPLLSLITDFIEQRQT